MDAAWAVVAGSAVAGALAFSGTWLTQHLAATTRETERVAERKTQIVADAIASISMMRMELGASQDQIITVASAARFASAMLMVSRYMEGGTEYYTKNVDEVVGWIYLYFGEHPQNNKNAREENSAGIDNRLKKIALDLARIPV